MAGAVLVAAADRLCWLGPRGELLAELPLAADPVEAARSVLDGVLAPALRAEVLRRRPPGPVGVLPAWLAAAFPELAAGPEPDRESRRSARERAAARGFPRTFYVELGRAAARRRLAAPAEVLITLAREEERLERALGREENAARSFLASGGGEWDALTARWSAVRGQAAEHHRALLRELETAARRLAPNLSGVVGPRVAARLLARAGGLGSLARMSSARLQLLGSRRRPGPGRSPRFGLIYRAERMEEVPAARQGAYARSLAALASLAVRIDAARGPDRSTLLRTRRDRRVADLRERSR